MTTNDQRIKEIAYRFIGRDPLTLPYPTTEWLEKALLEATEPLNGQLKGFQETVELQRQEIDELKKDKERLDFLHGKFFMAHQAAVISKMNEEWFCSSGFYSGDTIRQAIDSAISKQKE